MRLRRRTKARGQNILELACLVCLVTAVSVPAVRLMSRTARDTISAAIEFNSHSAMTATDPPGTPLYSYGEEPPAEPEGNNNAPDWPQE